MSTPRSDKNKTDHRSQNLVAIKSMRFPDTVKKISLLFTLLNIQTGGTVFPPLTNPTNKKLWEELIAYFPWYVTGRIENDASNNSSIVACVFVTAVTFLLSRCLAMIWRFLPSRCLATIVVPSRFPATIEGFLPSRCLATIGGVVPSRFPATIGGFLPSRCLATIRGLLPRRCLATIGGIHTHTDNNVIS
jgi:hypothetical protein